MAWEKKKTKPGKHGDGDADRSTFEDLTDEVGTSDGAIDDIDAALRRAKELKEKQQKSRGCGCW